MFTLHGEGSGWALHTCSHYIFSGPRRQKPSTPSGLLSEGFHMYKTCGSDWPVQCVEATLNFCRSSRDQNHSFWPMHSYRSYLACKGQKSMHGVLAVNLWGNQRTGMNKNLIIVQNLNRCPFSRHLFRMSQRAGALGTEFKFRRHTEFVTRVKKTCSSAWEFIFDQRIFKLTRVLIIMTCLDGSSSFKMIYSPLLTNTTLRWRRAYSRLSSDCEEWRAGQLWKERK